MPGPNETLVHEDELFGALDERERTNASGPFA